MEQTGRTVITPEVRLLVAVGFPGGFTTFSSFSYETLRLVEQSGWWAAGLNLAGNTGLGLVGALQEIFLACWLQRGG